MSEVLEYMGPPPGNVPLPMRRTVSIRVRIHNRAPVVAVRAEAYKGKPPQQPRHKLYLGDGPKIYQGEIPGLPGKFSVRVRAEFEGAPAEESDYGPFQLVMSAVNAVDVRTPPGHISLGMNNEFQVEVKVDAADFLDSVVARCIRKSDGSSIGADEPLMESDPWTKPGIYSGTIMGEPGGAPYKILATATFTSGTGASSVKTDEDGDYHS